MIRRERHGAVAVVTINAPEKRNALTDEVLAGLVDACADDARCIVIAGSEKVFASGADLRVLAERSVTDVYEGARARHWDALRRVRTPVVAAVSGFCLGGGCELALLADVVVASPTARFGLPETSLGLIPGAGGTQLLPRAVGKALAMDMVLTGRLLSAEEAECAGLVSRVADDWRETALQAAEAIAARPALASRLAKEAVLSSFDAGLSAGLGGERRAFAVAFSSDEAREGVAAFLDKRDPVWPDR